LLSPTVDWHRPVQLRDRHHVQLGIEVVHATVPLPLRFAIMLEMSERARKLLHDAMDLPVSVPAWRALPGSRIAYLDRGPGARPYLTVRSTGERSPRADATPQPGDVPARSLHREQPVTRRVTALGREDLRRYRSQPRLSTERLDPRGSRVQTRSFDSRRLHLSFNRFISSTALAEHFATRRLSRNLLTSAQASIQCRARS
jgi:hypothetical protein